MSDSVKNRQAFNGYHVTFYDHNACIIDTDHYPEAIDIKRRWHPDDEFPSATDVADDMYDVFGDITGKIVDNDGNVLVDRMALMEYAYNEATRW